MMLNPSLASVKSHSSIWSAIVPGVPTNRQAAVAAYTLRELPYGQILAPGQFDNPLASTLARVAFGNLRQGTVGIEARRIMAQRDRERCDGTVVMHKTVEPSSLRARFADGVINDHKSAGQDLQMVAIASELLHASFHVGIERARIGKVVARRKDDFGGLGGELPSRL